MDLSGTESLPAGVVPLLERMERWISRRGVSTFINVTALILLSYGLAQGTWRLVRPSVATGTPSRVGTQENPGDYNVQALLSANIFGQAASATKPVVELEAIPLSSLSLVLTSVMVTPAGSFALISADSGPETPFSVGQEISANVSLYAVYSDRALIRRGGAVESLMLKDAAQGLPNGSIVTPNPVETSHGVQHTSSNHFTVNRAQLTQQMQAPEFLTHALIVPNTSGGFLVREIEPGGVYEKLGMRVGDVINAVNGQPVNSVEDIMHMYTQFGSSSNVQIDIRRAGRNETLVYSLQ